MGLGERGAGLDCRCGGINDSITMCDVGMWVSPVSTIWGYQRFDNDVWPVSTIWGYQRFDNDVWPVSTI